MKLRRIDYVLRSENDRAKNIRVDCDPTPIYPLPAPVSMAFIGLGRTEDFSEDWKWTGDRRSFEDGAQGFEFESRRGYAMVWLECPPDALTVAEQIGPTEVCVVCIPRGSAA